MQETVLFVAFEFPPLGGGGVQRSLKFVSYLPQFGIRPVVVTVPAEQYPRLMPHHPIDGQLLRNLPDEVIVERIPCEEHVRPSSAIAHWAEMYFSISEIFKETWRSSLEQALPRLIEQYKPVAVVVTVPPFAMGTLWRKLLQRYSIPLIMDFRDAWSQWCVAVHGSRWHYIAKLKEERKVLQAATHVICTSDQIRKDLLQVHPKISPEKIDVITNGYDRLLKPVAQSSKQGDDPFVIGYVGHFYYTPSSRAAIFKPWWKKPIHRWLNYTPRKEDWLYRSPYFFFQAVRRLFDEHPALEKRLKIRFAGTTPDWLLEQIRSFGLEHICEHQGMLSHDEVIRFQEQCDALLVTSSKVIGGNDYSIAGKTFEYFTIGKPILAFVCAGAQRDLLQATRNAVICDPDEPTASAKQLLSLVQGKTIIQPDYAYMEQFHRKALTAKLAAIIQKKGKPCAA